MYKKLCLRPTEIQRWDLGVCDGQHFCFCSALCSYLQASLQTWGLVGEREREKVDL